MEKRDRTKIQIAMGPYIEDTYYMSYQAMYPWYKGTKTQKMCFSVVGIYPTPVEKFGFEYHPVNQFSLIQHI